MDSTIRLNLLEFKIVQENSCASELIENVTIEVCNSLKPKFGDLEKIFSRAVCVEDETKGYITLLASSKGTTVTIRTNPVQKFVTVTIEYDIEHYSMKEVLHFTEVCDLEKSLSRKLQMPKETFTMPTIRRGLKFDKYFITSDTRLLEYDIQNILFDEHSQYQHVQIARSINFGNLLILDNSVNLGEEDLTYTETLMCRGSMDYRNKDVLILGGGDGALLYELRKENAASITMIEIDEVVMKACKKHMRNVCGDSLDCYRRENYEIVIGDCISFMTKCKEKGFNFDVIFGDLTEIPISSSPNAQGEIWDFLKTTLQLSFSILKVGGYYLTHANGATSTSSLDVYKKTIGEALSEYKIKITQSETCVPSFMEKWVFFQVQKQ